MKNKTDGATEIETTYHVAVERRGGGGWTDIDGESTSHDTLAEAEDEMAESIEYLSGEDNEFGPGEYRVTISDDEGNEIDSEECIYDPTQDRLEDAEILSKEEGDFSALVIAVDSEGFFRVEKNGGSQGTWSKQEGDGRWSEMENEVEDLTLLEAIRALSEENGFSGAIDIVAGHGDCADRAAVIREITDDLDDEEREKIADEFEDEDDEDDDDQC